MAEKYQCRWCGGNVIPDSDGKTGVCEFCGKRIVFPKSGYKLMNQANTLRARMEFEQAEALYQSLAQANREDPEVWWNIVLCRYGILYVQEADRRVITVNRMKYDSVFEQEAYKKAIALADPQQRKIYEEEARTIQDIQERLLQAAAREEKYDIFISFKDKDADGKRTIDSVLAQDIYDALTEEGYRVFFSRITLRTAVGQEFEPKIFSALQTASMMILVASTPEHVKADWVKNEWSRYLKLMERDAGEYLLPVYTVGVKPEQLPASISALEGIQANGEGFMQLILDNVGSRLGRRTQATAQVSEEIAREALELHHQELERLLGNGENYLRDGRYPSADECFEEALDHDVDCARAWWGRLAAATENFREKGDFHQDSLKNRYYKEAMRLGTPEEKRIFAADLQRYEDAQRAHKCRELYDKFMEMTNKKRRVWTGDEPEYVKKYKEVLALEEKCLSYAEGERKKELEKEFSAYNHKRDRVRGLRMAYNEIEKKNQEKCDKMNQWGNIVSSLDETRRKARAYYPIKLSAFLAVLFLLNGLAMMDGEAEMGIVITGAGLFFLFKVVRNLNRRKKMCGGMSAGAEKNVRKGHVEKLQAAMAEALVRKDELPQIYADLQQEYANVKTFVFPADLQKHISEWQSKLDANQYYSLTK